MPVFGAGAFNPKGKIVVSGKTMTLAEYAARMNIQLLKPSDFNSKLREHGVDRKVTVQKVCRACRDERQVRRTLDGIWESPESAIEMLRVLPMGNAEVFEFEGMLVTQQ